MKSIKYRGREAVLVSELAAGANEYIYLTFLQRYDFGVGIITLKYDGLFGILETKEMLVSSHEIDAIQAFRMNEIDSQEFAERIQLAQ